jgi:hypothetical protein
MVEALVQLRELLDETRRPAEGCDRSSAEAMRNLSGLVTAETTAMPDRLLHRQIAPNYWLYYVCGVKELGTTGHGQWISRFKERIRAPFPSAYNRWYRAFIASHGARRLSHPRRRPAL